MAVIALFGATGKTGRRVLERALAAGNEVRALVRDPGKPAAADAKLTLVAGDVLDAATVEGTVEVRPPAAVRL